MEAPYENLTVAVLKQLCEDRGLLKTGLKHEIVERLQETDKEDRLAAHPIGRRRSGTDIRSVAAAGRNVETVWLPPEDINSFRARSQAPSPEELHRSAPNSQSNRPGSDANDLPVRSQVNRPGTGASESPVESQLNRQGTGASGSPVRSQLQDPQPQSRGFLDMTETQLEQMCRENYLPYAKDANGRERRAAIEAEHQFKYNDSLKKRDAAITRANSKHAKDVVGYTAEKDEKLEALKKEVATRQEKNRKWSPAFNQLRVCHSSISKSQNNFEYG